MLGLIHMLYFIEMYPKSSDFIYKCSLKEKVEFPLAVKMFEFTVLVMSLMWEGTLYQMCNKEMNVFETVAKVFCCLFHAYLVAYIEGGHNIVQMNDLNNDFEG